MKQNPLIPRIRKQMRHLPLISAAPVLDTLSLGELLDIKPAPQSVILRPGHPDHDRIRYDNARHVVPLRRRSPRPIPWEDRQETAPYGEGVEQFSRALAEVVRNYYPQLGIKPPVSLKAKATRRNLARLLEPLKQRLPSPSDNVKIGTLSFRDYFGDLLTSDDGVTVLFPVDSYESLVRLYPFPSRWPKYGGCMRDDLRRPLAAVWDFYRMTGVDEPPLLELPLERIGDFLAPLLSALGDYYPTGCFLESVACDEEDFWESSAFVLTYPYIHGDSEEAECVIAFLEGPESVAAYTDQVLRHLGVEQVQALGLAQEDMNLIEKAGLLKLVNHYASSDGGRTVPIKKLSDFWNAYFGEWRRKYPDIEESGWCPEIIAYDDMNIEPQSGRDILALKEYGEAFDRFMGDMPLFSPHWREGFFVEFLQELVRVYRFGHAAVQPIPIQEDAHAA